jgi:hypothetical protein
MYGRTSTKLKKELELELKKDINKPKKIKFLDSVFLLQTEYDKLITDYGKTTIESKIEDLDNYIGSKGKRYKSHYKTLLQWLKKDGITPKKRKLPDVKEYIPKYCV